MADVLTSENFSKVNEVARVAEVATQSTSSQLPIIEPTPSNDDMTLQIERVLGRAERIVSSIERIITLVARARTTVDRGSEAIGVKKIESEKRVNPTLNVAPNREVVKEIVKEENKEVVETEKGVFPKFERLKGVDVFLKAEQLHALLIEFLINMEKTQGNMTLSEARKLAIDYKGILMANIEERLSQIQKEDVKNEPIKEETQEQVKSTG